VKVKSNFIAFLLLLGVLFIYPQKSAVPVPLIVIPNFGEIFDCTAIGFFYKYHAKTVVIEGTQDSFNLEDEDGVNRLSLKYLVSAEFSVEEIQGKQKLWCKWTANFPWSETHEVFEGCYPRNLADVYDISLVCVGGDGEYHVDLRTIKKIERSKY
jgi:hypothetical protein